MEKKQQAFDRSVLFLLPVRTASGGAACVVQGVIDLVRFGINARIAVPKMYSDRLLYHYPKARDLLCIYSPEGDDLKKLSRQFDICIATNFASVKYLKRMLEACPEMIPMYYIQDYEVRFFPPQDKIRIKEAFDSYTLIPQATAFSFSNWLCKLINSEHGIEVFKTQVPLDTSLFNTGKRDQDRKAGNVRITAMVRPGSFIRAPRLTLETLKAVKRKYNRKVDIRVFGCSNEELDNLQESGGFEFINLGELRNVDMPELLAGADIFVDASQYQAFGFTGLEAMASGCATVLPDYCGTSEYARDGENCLLVNTSKKEDIIAAVSRLIEDKGLLERIKLEGTKVAEMFSLDKAAASQIALFNQVCNNKNPLISR